MYLSLIYLTYHIFAASPVLLSRQDSYADLENAVACENVALCFSFFWDTWRVLNRQVTGSGSVQGHEVWWVPPCVPSLPSHGLLAWAVPHNLSHMSISVLVPSGFLEPRYSSSGQTREAEAAFVYLCLLFALVFCALKTSQYLQSQLLAVTAHQIPRGLSSHPCGHWHCPHPALEGTTSPASLARDITLPALPKWFSLQKPWCLFSHGGEAPSCLHTVRLQEPVPLPAPCLKQPAGPGVVWEVSQPSPLLLGVKRKMHSGGEELGFDHCWFQEIKT